MQAVIFINLFMLEQNSKYLTGGARNSLGSTASFHINSVDTKLWGELDRCLQLVLSNYELRTSNKQ